MRRRLEREAPERLQVRMWLFPYLTLFAIAAIVVVIGSMATVDDVRPQLWWGLASVAVVLLAHWLEERATRRGPAASPGPAASGVR